MEEKRKSAMGIDWMSKTELRQAIPPAYTRYIGLQFFKF
jgi:DNA (cytosine-5)-methyltransferase 1